MAGILEAFNDPSTQGALSLASNLLRAGGPSYMPTSFGSGLGTALQGFQQDRMRQQKMSLLQDQALAQRQMQALTFAQHAQALKQAQMQEQALNAFASTLPPEEQAVFRANPKAFIEERNKKYVVGNNLVSGSGSTAFTAPVQPKLEEIPVPGQPGVTQKVWLKPGETQGVAVGGAKQPEILNPEVQKARMQIANAGAARVQQNVNAFTPASEMAQQEFMKSSRATYDQLKHAPVAIESIEKAKALVPAAKGFMGPGGEMLLEAAKFLNNRIGTNINTEGVKGAEELRTRIFFNILDNLKKMDAQPSQQQQIIMQQSLGKLGTDPNALPAVLDAFADVLRGKIDLHNTEVQGAVQRGVKFPYDPVIKMPAKAGAWKDL